MSHTLDSIFQTFRDELHNSMTFKGQIQVSAFLGVCHKKCDLAHFAVMCTDDGPQIFVGAQCDDYESQLCMVWAERRIT